MENNPLDALFAFSLIVNFVLLAIILITPNEKPGKGLNDD